jgi:threonine synthase
MAAGSFHRNTKLTDAQKEMNYYSTSNRKVKSTLKEAVLRGLAPDRGLYMPESFPVLDRATLESFRELELPGISVVLSRMLFGEDIPENELIRITEEAINFDTPLVQVEEGIHALELFHGPTLAFKDVGARFMARLLGYFTRNMDQDIHVLVATSGDTGSAVANGFLGVKGTRVHVLYPSGGVSALQEKQFTTLGSNITALEVDGSFDDCQRLVKEAFMDKQLNERMKMTSANSINLARFLPQAFYYFRAWAQLPPGSRCFFSVPSGNYGNMTGGLVAREMGLPVHTFLSVNNQNNVVASYLESGKFEPRPSVQTIANAMDVGDPSNFVRVLGLFNQKFEWIKEHLKGFSYSDREIRESIAEVHKQSGYLLDPHGATGYRAAQNYRKEHPDHTGIFLETAHPAKFKETVEEVIGQVVDVPERLAAFSNGKKEAVFLPPLFAEFRNYLMNCC